MPHNLEEKRLLKGLDGLKKIHFVGIGGAGMSALAKILLEMGLDVTGSDKAQSDNVAALAAAGATIFTGEHNAEAPFRSIIPKCWRRMI